MKQFNFTYLPSSFRKYVLRAALILKSAWRTTVDPLSKYLSSSRNFILLDLFPTNQIRFCSELDWNDVTRTRHVINNSKRAINKSLTTVIETEWSHNNFPVFLAKR